jgi:hypothetical protein
MTIQRTPWCLELGQFEPRVRQFWKDVWEILIAK